MPIPLDGEDGGASGDCGTFGSMVIYGTMYHIMTYDRPARRSHAHPPILSAFLISVLTVVAFLGISAAGIAAFDAHYAGRIYPNVTIDGIPFGGKTPKEVEDYWKRQNIPFATAVFELKFEHHIATVSGAGLDLGYDATLSATQAYAIGRSGHWIGDLTTKFFRGTVALTPYFRWKTDLVRSAITDLAATIDVPVQDALFQFSNGRVSAFRTSREGRMVNQAETLARFETAVRALPHAPIFHIIVNVPVDTVKPAVTTQQVNSFGIRELIGRGYSEFQGSIPGRIHNVALAASRLNGILVAPGETFSFNAIVGDISAATGYQSAYIIKEGRTVLGDGGGVCQVSSTLFRAALNAGLPIVERHAHAYRVHYYEEGGFKPGLDATVFSPSVDLVIKNDTPAHILIQTKTDLTNLTLAFELYGTHDGRSSEISNHNVWGETPPPPPLYQDDPTLKEGVVKQVDWAAWGAKASFKYRVTRGNDVLQDTVFTSNFQPWRAVYLKGTATP